MGLQFFELEDLQRFKVLILSGWKNYQFLNVFSAVSPRILVGPSANLNLRSRETLNSMTRAVTFGRRPESYVRFERVVTAFGLQHNYLV